MMSAVLVSLLLVAVAAVVHLRLRRRLVVVRVRGVSMEPTFHPGDRVLVAVGRAPQVGQVVVFRPPSALAAGDEWLIKRAVAGPGDVVPRTVRRMVKQTRVPQGCLVVLGDNNESYDSRRFGYIRSSDVLGPVVRRLHRRCRPPVVAQLGDVERMVSLVAVCALCFTTAGESPP